MRHDIVDAGGAGVAWLGAYAVGLAHAALPERDCVLLLLEAADDNRDVLRVAHARLDELTTLSPRLRARAQALLLQACGAPDSIGTAARNPR